MPTATADIRAPSEQLSALPDEVLQAAESQWLFTEEELLRAPSILDGLSPEKEHENRSKGVNFIIQVGIMLKLPQITLATAAVFLHRFYMRYSMQDIPGRPGHHYYSMAATSLFLATKVEENCRKMKDLVIACVRVAQKDPYKTVDEQDKEYWKWRDNILLNEDLLLEAICFDLRLEPPYKKLYDLLLIFGEENNKKLRNAAWAFISDSCLTTLCLLFSSKTIATSALYAAARHSGVAFSDKDGKPWWEAVGINLDEIGRACNYMAEIYLSSLPKGRENAFYEKITSGTDGARDLTRLTSPHDYTSGPHDELRHSPKRGVQELSLLNGHLNGEVNNTNGVDSDNPLKSQQVDGEGEQDEDSHSQVPHDSTVQHLHAQSKFQGDTSILPAQSLEVNRAENIDGLVSPKLDNGSEEGEVDA